MTAHTPGPWRWEVNRKSRQVQLCGGPPHKGYGKYDLTVMGFARYGMSSAAPVFWTWQHKNYAVGESQRADALAKAVPGREHHANWFAEIDHPDARLIAAAPELLEALRKAVTYVELTVSEECGEEAAEAQHDLNTARAAIAKAEGRAP
jgi:hypothetical protein